MHPQGDCEGPRLDAVNIVLRRFDPDRDQAFLYSSWRNSSYYHAAVPTTDSSADYFKKQTARIKRTLEKATVEIACLADCPSVIVGYVVYTGKHLDWIYVKQDYREKGIGRLLMPKLIETFTDSVTKIGAVLLEKKNQIQGEQKNASAQDPDIRRTSESPGSHPL